MASSDCPSDNVAEADADTAVDVLGVASAGGTTEYTEEVGAYLGDLLRLSLLHVSLLVS